MSGVIVILDDEQLRLDAMADALERHVAGFEIAMFRTAPDLIGWLDERLAETVLLSLDHDLIPVEPGGPDMGSGRDVADYLAARTPVCAVLIHTTNSPAGTGMEMVLTDAGWQCHRIHPYGDLEWVRSWWIREVRQCLKQS